MANPFSIFRKRQKLFLAIAGVGAMGAFIFLPILGRIMQDDRQGISTVVTTKYGVIDEREMSALQQQRKVSNAFFRQLWQLTLEALAGTGQIPPESLNRLAQFKENELLREGLLLPANETSVVRGMIAARRAEELGMHVSDERINALIARFTQDLVPAEQIAGILPSISTRISQQQLFDVIRPELMANDLLFLVNSGTQSNTSPAERWDYFLRTRQSTTAEIVAVSVDDFIDQVPDPSEKELLAFFNEYKEEYPQPGSPDPGFRLPERRSFEYFQADFEFFYDEEQITDEAVAAYYEENKANYPYQGLPPDTTVSDSAEEPAVEETTEEETSTEEAPQAEEEMPAEEAPPSEEEAEPNPEEPTEEPAAEDPGTESTEPPAEESSEPPAAEEDQASVLRGPGSLRGLFSTALAGALFLQEDDAPAADETASDSENETPAVEEEATTPDATSTEESAATESEVDKPFLPSLSLRDLSVDYLLPKVISEGPNPEFDPLWRVEESIRTTLAREQASEKMNEVLAPLREQMQVYSSRRLDWEIAVDESIKVEEPARLDFESMAQGIEGVSAHSTGIVSAQQLVDDWDLGNSTVVNSSGQAIGSTIEQSFGNSPDYSPTVAQDLDGNKFLYWITEKLEAKIPTLDDVREEVLLSWKQREARKLARQHAEGLADIAREPQFTSLAQAFSDKSEIKVVDTGSFSWLTAGDVPMNFGGNQLRLSEIPGVQGIGNDFMRGVFSLDPQSVGVFFNEPETAAYVVRVGEFAPSEFLLRQQFLSAPYSLYQNAGQIDRRNTQLRWFDDLLADADIKWVREPRDSQ